MGMSAHAKQATEVSAKKMASQRQNWAIFHWNHTSTVTNWNQGIKPRIPKLSLVEAKIRRKVNSNGRRCYSTSSAASSRTTRYDTLAENVVSTEIGLSTDTRRKGFQQNREKTGGIGKNIGTKSWFSRSTTSTNRAWTSNHKNNPKEGKIYATQLWQNQDSITSCLSQKLMPSNMA